MNINLILAANSAWAAQRRAADPFFFDELAKGQSPAALWIGCADSRVPPEMLTGCDPGDLFVHRNVANIVAPGDLNFMAVLHYAVDHLEVEHIVVCGHEGCGGVQAAHDGGVGGINDHWIAPIVEVAAAHAEELDACDGRDARVHRLVELNVEDQLLQLGRTPAVREARARGRDITLHGLVFSLSTGHLRKL